MIKKEVSNSRVSTDLRVYKERIVQMDDPLFYVPPVYRAIDVRTEKIYNN